VSLQKLADPIEAALCRLLCDLELADLIRRADREHERHSVLAIELRWAGDADDVARSGRGLHRGHNHCLLRRACRHPPPAMATEGLARMSDNEQRPQHERGYEAEPQSEAFAAGERRCRRRGALRIRAAAASARFADGVPYEWCDRVRSAERGGKPWSTLACDHTGRHDEEQHRQRDDDDERQPNASHTAAHLPQA
jgi:hypothetical protein